MQGDKKVEYVATANFSEVLREIGRLRKKLKELREDEAKSTSLSGASSRNTTAIRAEEQALDGASRSAQGHAAAAAVDAAATEKAADAHSELATSASVSASSAADASDSHKRLGTDISHVGDQSKKTTVDVDGLNRTMSQTDKDAGRVRHTFQRLVQELSQSKGAQSVGSRAIIFYSLGRALRDVWDSLSKVVFSFGKLDIIGGAIGPLIAGVGALGAAVLGLGSSLSSLSGIALALPGVLAAAATGIGSLVVAFRGFTDVFKAYSAQEEAIAKSSDNLALNRKQAALDLAEAEQAYAAAKLRNSRAALDAQRAVEDAELRVENAIDSVEDAEENLNQTRREGLALVRDARSQVEEASKDSDEAATRLSEAQKRLNKVMADPTASHSDIVAARADVASAERDVATARQDGVTASKNLDKAEKDRQERNEDAKKSLEDARREQLRAQQDYTRAVQDAAIAQKDAALAAQRAALSLKQIREEQKRAGDSTSEVADATEAYNDALRELSPSARGVVKYLIGLKDAWTKIRKATQEAFFSKFVGSMGKLRGFLPVVRKLLVTSAGAMGNFVKKALDLVTSGPWKRDFGELADRNAKLIETLGDALLPIADALRDITLAAAPFVQLLAEDLKKGAKNFADFVSEARKSERLADWLEKVRKRLHWIFEITKNIGTAIFNLGAASSGFGDGLLKDFVKITKGWADVARQQRKAGSPFRKFLEDIKPLLDEVGGLAGDLAGALGRIASDPAAIDTMKDVVQFLRDNLPTIESIIKEFAKAGSIQRIMEILGKVLRTFDKLMKDGAFEAFNGFLDTMSTLLDPLLGLLEKLGPYLGPIATAVGAIAAVKLVGQVTGLGSIVKLVARLVTYRSGLRALAAVMSGNPSKAGWLGKLAGVQKIARADIDAGVVYVKGKVKGTGVDTDGKGKDRGPGGVLVGGRKGRKGDTDTDGDGRKKTPVATGNRGGGRDGGSRSDRRKDRKAKRRGVSGLILTLLTWMGADYLAQYIGGETLDTIVNAFFAGWTIWEIISTVPPPLWPVLAAAGIAFLEGKSALEDFPGWMKRKRAGHLGRGTQRADGFGFTNPGDEKHRGPAWEYVPGREYRPGESHDRGDKKTSGYWRIKPEWKAFQDQLQRYGTIIRQVSRYAGETEAGIKGNTEAAKRNRQALLNQSQAALELIHRYKATGASSDEVKKKSRELRQSFIRNAQDMGATRKEAFKLWRQYSKLPRNVTTRVKADGLAKVRAEIERLSSATRTSIRRFERLKELVPTGSASYDPGYYMGTNPTEPRRGRRHAARGGVVPGQGNTDTVPYMLTPGEGILPKEVMKSLGPDRFDALRAGRVTGLGARGLVSSKQSTWNVTINNPKPEPSSQSLPHAIRSLQFVGVS